MGIKSFFKWFQNNYGDHIKQFNKKNTHDEHCLRGNNLFVDMNGLIHTSVSKSRHKTDEDIYKQLCYILSNIVSNLKPIKMYLCIDGIAPMGKQMQQRQRRFRTSINNDDVFNFEDTNNSYAQFDTNSISPGTNFMDLLCKKLSSYIKFKQSNDWSNIEVILSNDKVPGEGEHKIIQFIKESKITDKKFIIYGSDADLLMLSLLCHEQNPLKKIFVLRDKWVPNGISQNYLIIDIGRCAIDLKKKLSWDETEQHSELIIYDFIIMCFFIGNDFLPQIPTCELSYNILDYIIQIYKHTQKHLTDGILLIPNTLKIFIQALYDTEYNRLNLQLNDKNRFKDNILNSSIINNNIDKDKYNDIYILRHFKNDDPSLMYLQMLQWVFSYYMNSGKDINTFLYYPYYYAPTLKQLLVQIDSFHPIFPKSQQDHRDIFQQLLYILPVTSSSLLPIPLDNLLSIINNDDEITIDYSGKHQLWEGILIPPKLNLELLAIKYQEYKSKISSSDMIRNKTGFIFRYCNSKEYIIKFSLFEEKINALDTF
jgi:5'-3' exonuclease